LILVAALAASAAVSAPSPSARATERAEAGRCSTSAAAKGKARKKPPKRGALTPHYKRPRARWHMKPSTLERKRWLAEENPPLVIRPVHSNESFEVRPDPETGAFGPEAQTAAMAAFHWKADGSEHPIDDRLLELVYRAVKRYKAP